MGDRYAIAYSSDNIVYILNTVVEERMCEAEVKKSASLIVIPI